MSDGKTRTPFHCGSQFMDWIDRNCYRCAKGIMDPAPYPCELQEALDEAAALDGSLAEDIAKRIGLPDNVTI